MRLKKYQQGGQMPAQEPAVGGSPEEQLAMMAQEIVGQLGPEAALMLAEVIVQIVQQAAQPQEAPVYSKKGGKLSRVK